MKFINNGNSFLLSAPASIFAAEIKNELKRHTMFNGEKKQIIQSKRLADALFILWAGGAALLSYSLVYALRKPFTAAGFDGLDFFGMDYKTATSIVQISGYFISKLIGIKVISELKKENRLKFIILSVAVAELSLVLFGALPRPLNVFALFFNGLSLGCMWGVIFSFLEGRRVTDLLASLMGLSIAISSGTAKSVGLFVMEHLHISEFWMPAFIGAFAFPLLSLLGWLMTRMPQPTAADRALRSERVTLDGRARADLFKSFMPVLLMLFAANLFITVLQDIKEDFLVKILDVEAAGLSSWAFAKVDAVVTLIILLLFGLMSAVRSNIKGAVPAAGACDVRHSDLGIRGLQLRWVATATHDVAVPPEFVALYCLPQLPDVVLRAFHRLLPHQGECGVLYCHTRFYRVYRYGGGIGIQRILQSGHQLAGFL